MKILALSMAAAAMALPAGSAMAAPPAHAPAHGYYQKSGGYYNGARYQQIDDRRGRPLRRGERIWRGRDGRYHCKRDDGTTGLIIGGAVGALLGREIDSRGDRTLGTVLGAAGGALLGREIDRSDARCR